MSPTLPCIMSPEYHGWSCRHLPSCHHFRICQTMNKNSVTRFPGLWRQLLPQCLQARAWVNWPQRSSESSSAPSRPSIRHSIFLSLVAVYPEVTSASQNKELPSPSPPCLTDFSLNLEPKNYFCQAANCHFRDSETWMIPFCLDCQDQNYASGIVIKDMDSSIKLPYSNPSSATSYLWNLKLFNLLVPQFSHL